MLKDALTYIGGVTALCMVCFAFIFLYGGIVTLIDKIKRNYAIKHRFDKPPTAKCYCKDCVRHDDESERCYKFDGWHTADNWFCWDAEPRKEIKE